MEHVFDAVKVNMSSTTEDTNMKETYLSWQLSGVDIVAQQI